MARDIDMVDIASEDGGVFYPEAHASVHLSVFLADFLNFRVLISLNLLADLPVSVRSSKLLVSVVGLGITFSFVYFTHRQNHDACTHNYYLVESSTIVWNES